MPNETERPVPPALPTAEQVPAELRALKRWVCWKAVWDGTKWRKPPYSPTDGSAIGATVKYEAHFVDFDKAVLSVSQHSLDGVGFVFVEGDGYVGIDFDECRDIDTIQAEVSSWLRWFPTYQEISPSGTGVHAIGKGKIAKALVSTPLAGTARVEIYQNGRYFTFTGHRLGDETSIGNIQVGIDKLLTHLGTKPSALETPAAERPMLKLTARKLHQDNLAAFKLLKDPDDPQNSTLNSCAFFAARAFAAKVLDQTEEQIKNEILQIARSTPYCPGAEDTFRSGWESGINKPLAILEDDYPEIAETLEEFNQKFYVVRNFGGKQRVCWEDQNPNFTKGKSLLLGHSHPKDFESFYRNDLIQVGIKTDKDDQVVPIFKNKASVWLDHRYRRQYREVQFAPCQDLGKDIRNLWHGFAFEPRRGNCSLYLKHLQENVCRNDSAKYDYLLRWMAYAVRNPDEQGHAAIVIQGLKGVGKNVAAEGFSALWGQHALIVSDSSRITNNFNAHLRALCVLIADEAFFAGDRRHEGKLKSLITSGLLDIEAKGVDVVQVRNLLHLIILGNDKWLVPATHEERRFLVLNCSDAQRGKKAYFQAIHEQLDNGGYAALLNYLMYEVSMTGFNVRDVPHTEELREQMVESLRDVERAWFECLYTGTVPGRIQRDGTVLVRTTDMILWASNKSGRSWDNLRAQHIGSLFGPALMKFERSRPLLNEKSRYWVIPALKVARRLWNELRFEYGGWPDEGGEWDTIEGVNSR